MDIIWLCMDSFAFRRLEHASPGCAVEIWEMCVLAPPTYGYL